LRYIALALTLKNRKLNELNFGSISYYYEPSVIKNRKLNELNFDSISYYL
jgi:hypothetical protein